MFLSLSLPLFLSFRTGASAHALAPVYADIKYMYACTEDSNGFNCDCDCDSHFN